MSPLWKKKNYKGRSPSKWTGTLLLKQSKKAGIGGGSHALVAHVSKLKPKPESVPVKASGLRRIANHKWPTVLPQIM